MLVVIVSAFCQAAGPEPARIDQPFRGYEIVRCLLQEGKLVLRHDGKLLVARSGDTLPGSDIRVAQITERQAVLHEGAVARSRQGGVSTVPERVIILTTGPDGAVKATVYSATSGETASPAMMVQPISVVTAGSSNLKASSTTPAAIASLTKAQQPTALATPAPTPAPAAQERPR